LLENRSSKHLSRGSSSARAIEQAAFSTKEHRRFCYRRLDLQPFIAGRRAVESPHKLSSPLRFFPSHFRALTEHSTDILIFTAMLNRTLAESMIGMLASAGLVDSMALVGGHLR
jgi:hypothetical protein